MGARRSAPLHRRGLETCPRTLRDRSPPHDGFVTPLTSPATRETCYACHKPASLCLCAHTSAVDNRTRVTIVQHKRERFHSIGTARIARLGLRRLGVVSGAGHIARPTLAADAALLYPGPTARDLATLSAHERPSELVVLDGTWHHARRFFLDNAWLRALPQVRLSPAAPSRYRIRRPPAPECLSTIESIVEALSHLEPDTPGFDGLLDVFDRMIRDQIAFIPTERPQGRFQTRRPRPSRAVPRDAPSSIASPAASR